MTEQSPAPVKIGAIRYLNSRPLTIALPQLAPQARIIYDVPSRLADAVAAGRIDVALLPSIECFRRPEYTVVSDVCVSSRGPVRSVKLFTRVPLERIATLAADEGSRTSTALAEILLREQFGCRPRVEPLPLGARLDALPTDAVLLIGDRCLQTSPPGFDTSYDLGRMWHEWTGLPMVFAMWQAGPAAPLNGLGELLAAARDEGLRRIEAIAAEAGPRLGLSADDCLSYLRDALGFRLGPREYESLRLFHAYCVKYQLAPRGSGLVFHPSPIGR